MLYIFIAGDNYWMTESAIFTSEVLIILITRIVQAVMQHNEIRNYWITYKDACVEITEFRI